MTTTPPVIPPYTVTVTVTIPPPGTEPAIAAQVPPAHAPAASATPVADVAVAAPGEPAPVPTAAAAAPAAPEGKPSATAATPPVANASEAPAPAEKKPAPEASPEAAPATPQPQKWKKWLIPLGIAAVLVAAGLVAWQMLRPKGPGEGFISSNGRIEATEIDVSSKFSGRVQDILVADGDFVTAGQTLAHMQVQTLEAQRDEAQARYQQSLTLVASAEAQVAVRESDRHALQALVAQRMSELDAAQRRLARSETLAGEGASSDQELDDDRARVRSVQAAVVAAKAQVQAAQSAIMAARAQVAGARSTVDAAQATIDRIKVDIDDSALVAPRDGRVQYRIAQPGEVLAAGGKVLNLVDLGDVYMTFFVPETAAGKLALGSEVHIVLDAAPQYVIPATISFVASTAQFTPKTVETASERQKLMFRVKARIGRDLLEKNITQVKTGLPGMVWLKLDPQAQWPPELTAKVPQ
ncbi:HlyD family secretion protein [Desulfomicrobium baculatum]|uniref:Secretion protein HlyD family protein n=1 Tax=Desulfomicrobium baculatum (strain DSM 4028 / VKM B-1378 / X) TaxID=525897 RepID=C7LPN4_DESBD|nr:HlyD family efflux transporter periplasmic adaptor subunit [Desulfomicrobium baculatum]ACU90263.1 secretion protein HlyD family protein [Desulfomicrobium baculatum DSM 4028]